MVNMNEFGRKTIRKVDLRVVERDRGFSEPCSQTPQSRLHRHRLSLATGTIDENLLERMIHQGFYPENLAAIQYSPIAEVAWASGRVTQFEKVFALGAAMSSDLMNTPCAYDLLQSWLVKHPEKALWSLWEDYMVDRFARVERTREEEFGRRLYETAARIAMASGGLLDQGDICVAEQRVLDRIARVYGLSLEAKA
jgi:hypothetical protein